MHSLFLSTFTLLLGTVFPFVNAHVHSPVFAKGVTAPELTPRAIRPSVVENGADVIIHPFPFGPYGNNVFQSTNVAVTPDGSVYFPDKFGNAVDRIDPTGAFSQLPAAHASNYSIYYLHDALWIPAYPTGIVKINTDGTGHRWYPLNSANTIATVAGIAALSNVTYIASYLNTSTGAIEQIDAHGVVQTTKIPCFPTNLTAGRDGNLYFSYVSGQASATGIGRIASNGLITYYPAPNGPGQLVYSNGYVYFLQYYFKEVGYNNQSYVDFSKMNATTGAVTEIGLPGNPVNATPGQLSVDDGGNIWLGVETDPYHDIFNLYQYDTYNGRFTGPVEPGLLDFVDGGVNVGPDDNIYGAINTTSNAGGLAVYVRHIQTLEPAALTITAASPATFSILETHYNGPWTAQSLSPSVVSVSPATSANGSFTVSEGTHGSARILVKDRLGNVSYETVSAD